MRLPSERAAARNAALIAEMQEEEASRAALYAGYEDPRFAEFVGADHICQTCGAVTAEMAKHLAWHAAERP